MDPSTSEVTESLYALLDATGELEIRIKAFGEIVGDAIRLQVEGYGIYDTMAMLPITEVRKALDEAVVAYYDARQAQRGVVITAGIAEGMSTADIVDKFGLPPDVVVRHSFPSPPN